MQVNRIYISKNDEYAIAPDVEAARKLFEATPGEKVKVYRPKHYTLVDDEDFMVSFFNETDALDLLFELKGLNHPDDCLRLQTVIWHGPEKATRWDVCASGSSWMRLSPRVLELRVAQ